MNDIALLRFNTLLLGSVLLVCADASTIAAEAVSHQSSIEGKWLVSHVGTADNQTSIGLDIVSNKDGNMTVRSTMPIMNVFAQPVGIARPAGDAAFEIAEQGIKLDLKDRETLVVDGLLGGKSLSMSRTHSLPSRAPKLNLPTGPGPRWRVNIGGAIYAPVAVRAGTVYVGNTDGVLFALNETDGTLVWTFSAGHAFYGGALAVDDAVFVASDDGFLYKINRTDGKEIWHYELTDARTGRVPPNPFVYDYDDQAPTPLLVESVVYIGAADGSFHAVNAVTGKRVWRVQSNAKIRTTAAVKDSRVVFATMDGWVVALDRSTGAEDWSFKNSSEFTSGPAIFGDVVIVGNRDSRLRGLDESTGTERWKQTYWGSWVESTAVFREGKGYIGSGDLFLVSCFDPATGTNLWRTNVGGWVMQRPAVTDSRVYVGVSSARRRGSALVHQIGAVTALDRGSGKALWSWPMPEWPGSFLNGFFAAPVVADGFVFIGGVDGSLYAFPDREH